MSRRLAETTLRLYPLAFRRRYADEMCALLDETPATLFTVLDLFRGALAAHLRPPAATAHAVGSADRLRASASGVLACWVVFAAAGFGFYKTTEDSPFGAAGHAHPVLAAAHAVVQALGIIASAAVLLGALPLISAALAEARRRPGLRATVALPPIAVLVFAALTGVLIWIVQSEAPPHPTPVGGVGFIAWGVAGLACGAVCVMGSRAALFAVPLSRARLLGAFGCGAVTAAAMAMITLASALYAIALPVDAARLAGAANGPLHALSVGASLALQVVVMAAAGALGCTTMRRAWPAATELLTAASP